MARREFVPNVGPRPHVMAENQGGQTVVNPPKRRFYTNPTTNREAGKNVDVMEMGHGFLYTYLIIRIGFIFGKFCIRKYLYWRFFKKLIFNVIFHGQMIRFYYLIVYNKKCNKKSWYT